MSDYTKTPHYALYKPTPDADNDMWGDHLNTNADILDSLIYTVEAKAGVTSWNTRTGAVTMNATDVTTALTYTPYNSTNPAGYQTAAQVTAALPVAASTLPLMDNVATIGSGTTWARADHIHPVDTSRYSASNPAGYQTAAQVSAVLPVASSTLPLGNGTAAVGTGTTWARADHVHPAGATLTVSDTAPALNQGAMWFDSVSTQLYVGYIDPTGPGQWVIAVNSNVPDLSTYAPLASPPLTGNPTAPTPAYGDNDTSIATTAFVQAAAAPYANDSGRNLIHNGQFNVLQRGGGPWTTTNNYTADRWQLNLVSDTVSVLPITLTDSDRTAIGDESAQTALQNTFTGNAAAGACNYMRHPMEDVRRLAGKTITISFWAKAASGTPKLGIDIDQNFGTGGSPSAAVTGNGVSVTLATTWARYSVTLTVPSIVGKTLGTAGGHCTSLNIWYSSGATLNIYAGNIGVQSGTIQLWGVQLEIGSVATPLAKRDPADELRLCQRYFARMSSVQVSVGAPTGGTYTTQVIMFPVHMRAAPSATVSNQTYGNGSALNVVPAGATIGGSMLAQTFMTATSMGAAYCTFNVDFSADL